VDVPRSLAEAALRVAAEVDARAVIALTETGKNLELLSGLKSEFQSDGKLKFVVATSNPSILQSLQNDASVKVIGIMARPVSKTAQAYHAIAQGLHDEVFSPGDRLVCLMGNGTPDMPDTLMVVEASPDHLALRVLGDDEVLSSTVELCLQLAEGGPDGKPLGTAFVLGNCKKIMRYSYQLMLNPLEGHRIKITDRSQWGFLKKFASFDGAFVVDSDGTIVAACRYLNARRKVEVPKGLGTRHLAVASMTAAAEAIGVTVSGEDGHIRIFDRGKMVAVLDPKTKLMEYFEAARG
jgi:DNA integrity scanning protein DisA with diadenylate cyclase activity